MENEEIKDEVVQEEVSTEVESVEEAPKVDSEVTGTDPEIAAVEEGSVDGTNTVTA